MKRQTASLSKTESVFFSYFCEMTSDTLSEASSVRRLTGGDQQNTISHLSPELVLMSKVLVFDHSD